MTCRGRCSLLRLTGTACCSSWTSCFSGSSGCARAGPAACTARGAPPAAPRPPLPWEAPAAAGPAARCRPLLRGRKGTWRQDSQRQQQWQQQLQEQQNRAGWSRQPARQRPAWTLRRHLKQALALRPLIRRAARPRRRQHWRELRQRMRRSRAARAGRPRPLVGASGRAWCAGGMAAAGWRERSRR